MDVSTKVPWNASLDQVVAGAEVGEMENILYAGVRHAAQCITRNLLGWTREAQQVLHAQLESPSHTAPEQTVVGLSAVHFLECVFAKEI